MTTFTTTDIFTPEQVQDFARVSGDDQYIHGIHGVVQGGFIISKLAKWLEMSRFIEQPFIKGTPYVFTAKMKVKFSKPVKVDTPIKVMFTLVNVRLSIVSLHWVLTSAEHTHCWGDWKIALMTNPEIIKIRTDCE
jgi:acyl dehydratase